jgi:uncharacterized protein YbjT (DUF2867 family)
VTQNNPLFLITGATGTQGGATARALLTAGRRVRILTRNPASVAAAALAKLGADVAKGDMGEPDTLAAAMQGVHGVYSVQRPDADGSDSERRHGIGLIEAARKAGVRHFVHTSVCQVDQHRGFPLWEQGYWSRKYWTDKWDVEQAVSGAGFAHWTVLRPTFFMENFARPKGPVLYPQLRQGTILTPVLPDARVQLIAGDDMGAFALAAFANPTRFNQQIIEIVSDNLTMGDIATVMSRVLHKTVVAKSVSPQEALDAGIFPMWVRSQEWINVVGYRVDAAKLPAWGVPLTPFASWVQRHAAEIDIET